MYNIGHNIFKYLNLTNSIKTYIRYIKYNRKYEYFVGVRSVMIKH